jgi:hypothetical protein
VIQNELEHLRRIVVIVNAYDATSDLRHGGTLQEIRFGGRESDSKLNWAKLPVDNCLGVGALHLMPNPTALHKTLWASFSRSKSNPRPQGRGY